MQIRTYNTLAIALATLLAAPLAMAQADNTSATSQNATARQPMSPLNSDISQATFTHLDKNRDGRVSADEARADSSFKSRFAALDTDHNGYVSSSELSTSANANGKTTTTTMGNADWSDDGSASGTTSGSSSTTSGTNSTGTTNSSTSDQSTSDQSTSDQNSNTGDTQSDDGSSTPPKP
jgi:hypothetical protein